MIENLLTDEVWVVPKLDHDENRGVGPWINGSMIGRSAGSSDPEHTRFYARQLLAAADEAERRGRTGANGCGYTLHGWACCSLTPVGQVPPAHVECGGPGLCGDCKGWVFQHCARAEQTEAPR